MRQTLTLAALATMVLACGSADAHAPVRMDLGRVSGLPYGMRVELIDTHGGTMPTAYSGGRRYALGEHGGRYTIRVTNPSSRRVEAVVSVDGLDVIDGKAASQSKRGYVINPYSEVRIEGWRTSMRSVAAFRFGRVADSYAARTGSARNVGVIGVAVFAERRPPPPPRPLLPRYRHYHDDRDEHGGARGDAAPAPESKHRKAPAKPSAAPPATARGQSADESRSGGAGRVETESASPSRRGYRPYPGPRERPGLGTEYGEQRGSHVQLTTFVRLSSRPVAYAELRYNDERGLARLGIDFHPHPHHHSGDDLWQRETANPFPAGRSFAAPPPGRQ